MIIIDRFEHDSAVIEYNGRFFTLPKELLPSDAQEGDILRITIKINKEATAARKKAVESLMEELFRD